MLTLAGVIIPKHKYDCVNLLLKTLQSLPCGLPSPNLERSTRHVVTHSSLPLGFQHLLPPADALCPPPAPTMSLICQPASFQLPPAVSWKALPDFQLSSRCTSKFCSDLTISKSPLPWCLSQGLENSRCAQESLQNEWIHNAVNFRGRIELLHEESEKIIITFL